MPSDVRKETGAPAIASATSKRAAMSKAARGGSSKRKVQLAMRKVATVMAKVSIPVAMGANQGGESRRTRKKGARRAWAKPPLLPVVMSSELARADPALAAVVSEAITNYLVNPATYASAFKKYAQFCDDRKLEHFPAKEIVICGFILDSSTTVKQSSIKNYLAAIRYTQVNAGVKWEIPGQAEHVRRVLRYCKRVYGAASKASKVPISCEVLMQMCGHIGMFPDFSRMSHDDRVFVTAATIGICGFLRGGEFLTYPGSKRPVLTQEYVQVTGSGESAAVVVVIERPKNLWWIPKVTVRCAGFEASSILPLNPAEMLLQYRALAGQAGVVLTDRGAAFKLSSNATLSRDWMVKRSAELLAMAGIQFRGENGMVTCVKAASWRAGAVRSAIDAKVPSPTIMALGRWRSYAWLNYASFTEAERDVAMASIWRVKETPMAPIAKVGITCPEVEFAALDAEAEAKSAAPQF